MTVVARGDGELTAWIGEAMRPLAIAALDVDSQATEASLAKATAADERERLSERLALCRQLREQLEQAVGRGLLVGPEHLVRAVIRDAASQAAHELDGLVERLVSQPEPLTDEAIEELRASGLAVTSGIEALIACEGGR